MSFKNFKTGNSEIDQHISELSKLFTPSENHNDLRLEILTTIAKFFTEHKDLGDYKLINTTLKELRHAFRVFHSYRNIRKVVIFGSARTKTSDPNYKLSFELSKIIAEEGMMVITGAGGGIMEAANKGAGKQKSFGINIKLPYEQVANQFINDDLKLMEFKYFFTRKLIFIKESDATVLLPGGLGTLDEGFENLTLFQTGKSSPRPIILLEPKNGTYWHTWIEWIESVLVKNKFISPDDVHLFQLKHSSKEAYRAIHDFYHVYHSLRYYNELTILRFTQQISQKIIDRLNVEYSDIIEEGVIYRSPPLQGEIDKNDETLKMPRLIFKFNKKSFGRLNQMIRSINDRMI